VRDYLLALRALLAGKAVDYARGPVRLEAARLAGGDGPRVPIYLAAIGPRMLRLAGELADGVVLAYCTPESIAWSREQIADGARRAGREPSAIRVTESIPVVVDRDVERARRTLAHSMLDVALGPRVALERRRKLGYRGQLERLGFADALAKLDRLREQEAPREALIDAIPEAMLRVAGYYGPGEAAASTLARSRAGLDLAIVRVTAARYSMASARSVVEACPPRAFAAA
jgi:alkanesulfonate monooxygenase SsuD/methylene tetrahydromethanopterin reductase-like flavin-dependent oxidoreductase (luciferase family)